MIPSPELATVALYAGLNGLILLWLSMHVSRVRTRLHILVGDAGNPAMVRAMRGQANFVEYVPLCLTELMMLALLGASVALLHLAGLALTAGRLLHGWHFAQADAPGWQRFAGAGLTLLVLAAASLWLVAIGLVRAV